MAEKIAENIWRIGVVLPDNPLRELNCYFIRGKERDLLIDTGFRCKECEEALRHGLAEVGAQEDRLDLFITHCHSDHAGLAASVGTDRTRVYLSSRELRQLKDMIYGSFHEDRSRRFLSEGFAENDLHRAYDRNPSRIQGLDRLTDRFVGLEDGDHLRVGEYDLQMLLMPGHTPGNTMLWEKKHGYMFTGDHVLYDITPNITLWDNEGDYLGNYLESLKRSAKYPVIRSFPGHRKTGDYHARIAELLTHHEERLQEVLGIVERLPDCSAARIASFMKWRFHARTWGEAVITQKWFAVGEYLAHLEHLRRRGLIERYRGEEAFLYKRHNYQGD